MFTGTKHVRRTGRVDSHEVQQMSYSCLHLLMSPLTAGSSAVIKMSDCSTQRGRGENHLLQPVPFILAPALMKSAYWYWRMHDWWHSRAWDLTLYQASHSEWAVTQVHDSLWSTGTSVATLDLQQTAIDVLAPLTGINLIVGRNGCKYESILLQLLAHLFRAS